jgi:YidC/Oxa1 family membrane protein insertase
VRRRRNGPYPYGLTTANRQPHPLDQALFTASPSPDGRSVTFRYRGPEGEAEKTFGFGEHGLLDVRVRVAGSPGWGLAVGPGIRNLKAEEMKSQFVKPGVVFKRGEVSLLAPQSTDEARSVPGDGLQWIGIEDTYFLAAMIPQSGLDRAVVEPYLIEGADAEQGARFIPLPPEDQMSKAQKDLPRDLRLVLKAAGETLALRSYWGSKEYEKLAALPYGLQETVQLGYFSFLVRPLLAGLHWIYDHIVPNYGWAIVLMTVLIRILLLPLTHTSMKSMKKMQELNPKMQAIRAKYATKLRDKQGKPNVEMQRKMNEEMMGLYKEHGVNPAGGCLPILLQMPILFAFYNLLSTAVELRGAPWLLWIRDLSAADPYYVLPLVMGATQFLQVKLSPQTGDPMQRRMFMIMPLAFTFLFLGFPSGLVLYWLTNNVLTIVQQGVYNRLQTRSA